jgi:hypothetical protein
MIFIAYLLILLFFLRILFIYSRLALIPGPFLAGLTDIWRYYARNSPGYGERMLNLHRKYGTLVRIGPNMISVSDPGAISTIYDTKNVWRKVCNASRIGSTICINIPILIQIIGI